MPAKVSDYQKALNHRYITVHGRKPAVGGSTIAGCLDTGKSRGMAYAASKIAAEHMFDCWYDHAVEDSFYEDDRDRLVMDSRDEFRRQWDEKKNTGSRVHDNALDWWMGRETDVRREDRGYVLALETAIRVEGISPILAERVILFPEPIDLEFGGRFDVLATVNSLDGRTILIDLKTGKRRLHSVTLQLNGYARGKLGVYDATGDLVGYRELPEIEGLAALYLGEKGNYELIELPYDEEQWTAFKALRYAYGSANRFKKFEREHPAPEEG